MGDPISWRGVKYGSPVLSSEGTKVGTVHEILGSDAEDVFHGVRVELPKHRDVMVAADVITSLTTDGVATDLSADAIEALPAYDDVATYHLASVGWLRHHLGWRQDSKNDEEAG